MDESTAPEGASQESGKELREKLESAIAESKRLQEENKRLAATVVIKDQGLDRVKPEDLLDVPSDELEAKAKEIQEARRAEEEAIFARIAREKGLNVDELEAKGGIPEGLSRAGGLGSITGSLPGQGGESRPTSPVKAIEAAL